MLASDLNLTRRLEEFLRNFRVDFRRPEQARWAAVYLQALLQTEGRKTIENLARAVFLPDSFRVEDVAQALQHFINQSPWDEQRIYRRYQRGLADLGNAVPGAFVLDEFAFVKQGRHSVGVQRQYSSALGRKVNCQIAIALHHISAAGFQPLALRLYLPRLWRADRQRLDAAGVPEEARLASGKIALALELLDEARAAGISSAEVVPGVIWGRTAELATFIQERGMRWRAELTPEWVEPLRRGREELQNKLGLDHFEGRSWRGFHHHACLAVMAYALSNFVREEVAERS